MMLPAVSGASRPAKFAMQLVKDMSIPANLGEMSRWLTLKPE